MIPSQLKIDTKVFAGVLDKVHIQTSSYGFLTFLGHVWGAERSDLAKFIFWPEIDRYQFRMDWILPREFLSFLKKRRESSAKKR